MPGQAAGLLSRLEDNGDEEGRSGYVERADASLEPEKIGGEEAGQMASEGGVTPTAWRL